MTESKKINSSKDGVLFLRVREDLAKRIAGGEFPLGSQLPTEAALIKRYQVSITTIRKAVQTLADEGVVRKRQGTGTFVTGYPGGDAAKRASGEELLNIVALLPDTTRITKEGDKRHWALNLRRLNGICSAAARRRSQVFVHGLNEKLDFSKFHGAIIIASYAYSMEAEDARLRVVSELEALGLPCVTISEFDPRFASRLWVAEMTEAEFYKAVRGLFERGCRRIALLGPALDWANPRYAGYRKALTSCGLPFEQELLMENPESDERSGREACARLLERLHGAGKQPPDAIFCTTDLQAYGAMSCLLDAGFRIPEDISLMGVDNLAESSNLTIPLSSVEFSGPEVGEAAVDLLFEARKGAFPNGRMVSCPGLTVWRASVAGKRS